MRSLKQDLFILFIAVTAFIACIPVITYAYFAKDLTTKEKIMNRNDTGVILLDREEKPFFSFYQAKYKEVVPLSEIAKPMQQAVIAAEDKDFYSHSGFSIRGILRSVFVNVQRGETASGGSTITQQLVKNALLTANKSFLRKFQEIVLAQEIERRYSKNEILEMYLNSVYFGEGAFGVEEAAQTYFGKSAKELTAPQASLLAGLLPSPSSLSPLSNDPKEALGRQKVVLRKMIEQKFLPKEQEEKILTEKVILSDNRETMNSSAPHFALVVLEELKRRYGEEIIARSGFKVKTTIDIKKQEIAEEAVKKQVANLAKNNASNGAAVVIDPKTGEILAMVGSKDWYDSKDGKLNIATTPRQPGSSFKPIIYAAALEKQLITPATILQDQPTTFQVNYKPQNYDRKFRGPVTVRRSLANSLNVPAVEIMKRVGLPAGVSMARRLGITTLEEPSYYGLSLVLGTGQVNLVELTNAYAVFANNGIRNNPTVILEIRDKEDKPTYTYKPKNEQVLEPALAFLISSILSDNTARTEIFGNTLTISRPAAVKTGTTENYKDALTVGYTPSLAIGVWVGNNDNKAMDNIAGSLGAAPIWKTLMETYLADTTVERFEPPSSVVAISICGYNGLRVKDATSSAITEYFVQGTEPKGFCTQAPVASSPNTQSAAAPQPTSAQNVQQQTGSIIYTGPDSSQRSGRGNDKKEDDKKKD